MRNNNGAAYHEVLFLILFILKLFRLIDISWLAVFSPLLIFWAFVLFIALMLYKKEGGDEDAKDR